MVAEIVEDLRKIETLKNLPEEDLAALAGICTPMSWSPGSILAKEGLDAKELFALTKGNVGIWIDHENTEADLLAVTEAPCLVGEMAVADQLPRSATVVAGTPLAGYSIDADSFRDLLAVRGNIALALMQGISRLVRNSNDSFVSELRERNVELEAANKELRAAQKQLVRQERLSSLGRFSSMIIHDLRNPLSVINGYADMLEMKLDEDSTELRKYVSRIRRESNRLSGLTGEWLDYSRGEIRLAYSAITSADLFQGVEESIGTTMAGREIDLTWDNGFNGTAMLDAERMTRVLTNLADNARKACRKGDTVTFSSRQSGEFLVLEVRDTGCGMDRETLNHVFEPFYSTSDRGGTGLGMHIVKTVVEAHGGHIGIESVQGEGTDITMEIPLRL